MKEDLMFYSAYEKFYHMAEHSKCFSEYCSSAFGADFSQDGFSDLEQINLILKYIPKTANSRILDIGCGNGKMLKYLQHKVGGYVNGFDYSEKAIQHALSDKRPNADFKVGIIGKINYPKSSFNFIISMDTIYFASDMYSFVSQIHDWLTNDGLFFIGYQEGDIMAKTQNCETSLLAGALKKNGFQYHVIDFTKPTYEMLLRKRQAAIHLKDNFRQEGLLDWYSIILSQTDSINVPYKQYAQENARYIFIARKEN